MSKLYYLQQAFYFNGCTAKYKDIFAINKHIDNKNKLTRNFVNTDYFKLYVNLIHSSINI